MSGVTFHFPHFDMLVLIHAKLLALSLNVWEKFRSVQSLSNIIIFTEYIYFLISNAATIFTNYDYIARHINMLNQYAQCGKSSLSQNLKLNQTSQAFPIYGITVDLIQTYKSVTQISSRSTNYFQYDAYVLTGLVLGLGEPVL